MTPFFWLLTGSVLPTLAGWLLLSFLEGRHPVLHWIERIGLGCLLGITLLMYLTFLLHIAGLVAFTRTGFLAVQIAACVVLGAAFILQRRMIGRVLSPKPPAAEPMGRPAKIFFGILFAWSLLKIIAGAVSLTQTPVYFDDVFNNWNMRAKIYFATERLAFDVESGNDALSEGGVNSYPPTVPMFKTWLAKMADRYDEGIINAVHILWYLLALILLYAALRRFTTRNVALLGAYLLASMPLYLLHGTNPYADVFLSAHIFAAVSLPLAAFTSEKPEERRTFFRLGALAAGLLVFTKNEALVMHLPVLLLLIGIMFVLQIRSKSVTARESAVAVASYAAAIAAVAVPWVLFKWAHDLPFGNAKGLPGFQALWQPGVPYAIAYNIFFEANWILLFPVLVALIVMEWRRAFQPPLLLAVGFFLIIFGGQLALYLFTGLATEALRQTGITRGMLHLVPVCVFIVTMLLAPKVSNRNTHMT